MRTDLLISPHNQLPVHPGPHADEHCSTHGCTHAEAQCRPVSCSQRPTHAAAFCLAFQQPLGIPLVEPNRVAQQPPLGLAVCSSFLAAHHASLGSPFARALFEPHRPTPATMGGAHGCGAQVLAFRGNLCQWIAHRWGSGRSGPCVCNIRGWRIELGATLSFCEGSHLLE